MKISDEDVDIAAFRQAIGKHIERVRKSKGMSQDRVTNESGISRGALSKIERGMTDPKSSTLFRIAAVLGVPAKKLLDFEFDLEASKRRR